MKDPREKEIKEIVSNQKRISIRESLVNKIKECLNLHKLSLYSFDGNLKKDKSLQKKQEAIYNIVSSGIATKAELAVLFGKSEATISRLFKEGRK